MPGGTCRGLADLPLVAREVIDAARRAVLSTIDERGGIASVPICFAISGNDIITAVDHKPKSKGVPARVRNVERDPRATVLFDRWSEDWTRLAWVMVRGDAVVLPAGERTSSLEARYAQYRDRPPRGDVIAITPRVVSWWAWTEASGADT